MYRVDNAVIMSAGTSSRFAPLSFEKHKALTVVRGEVLIERQIRQLQEVGIPEIYVVTGYKAEQFEYLQNKFGVKLIYNPEYLTRNNHSSIYAARDVIRNSFICSADNYFAYNPFETEVEQSYYAVAYSKGMTQEWCIKEDQNGVIKSVNVGGQDSWYMFGHVFWDQTFSKRFLTILGNEYDVSETVNKLWENIYIEHLNELKMQARKYPENYIYEFDTLDELRTFDPCYINDTRSEIMKKIAEELKGSEAEIKGIEPYKEKDNSAAGIIFHFREKLYQYSYQKKIVKDISNFLETREEKSGNE